METLWDYDNNIGGGYSHWLTYESTKGFFTRSTLFNTDSNFTINSMFLQ